MNHTIPIMKTQSQSYKNHLTPIAPAPLLAPKPVQVLPKPFNNVSRSSSSTSISTLKTSKSLDSDTTASLPCIITSKQWVLPPRPKAGRKPGVEKKKLLPSTSSSSIQCLSNNMTTLNIQKSQSEILNMNANLMKTQRQNNTAASVGDTDLKVQLESATEENQKLKNIISRLKTEIDSLQKTKTVSTISSLPEYSSPISSFPHISSNPIERTNSITSVSTPNTTTNTAITSREVSPTVDPKYIGMGQSSMDSAPANSASTSTAGTVGTKQPRVKRQYKKKKKKEETVDAKKDETPSPISLSSIPWDENHLNPSGLPKIENIVQRQSSDAETELDFNKPKKKTKTLNLEKRSMSVQTQDLMLSPPSGFNSLDRTLSMDPFEFNLHTHNLSRTTTMTTIDNDAWDPLNSGVTAANANTTNGVLHRNDCGLFGGSECLCKKVENEIQAEFNMNDMNMNPTNVGKNDNTNYIKDNMKNYVINENDELDLAFFIKTEEEQIGIMGL